MAIDRNAADSQRLRRNQQRGRAGGLTSGVSVTAPLSNTGSRIQLNLDSAGGLESSSSLLRVKLRDASLTRDASGLGILLRGSPGLQIAGGLGILLNGSSLVLGASGLSLGVVTTKGDLLGFSTLTARIPVGSDGTVLTSDSTQALGLKWAAGGLTSRLLTSSVTSGASVSNTTTETDLPLTYAAAANELKTGSVLRVRFGGRYTGDGVAGVAFKVYYGATVIVNTGSLPTAAAGTSKGWLLDSTIQVGTAGAAATVKGITVAGFNGLNPFYVVDNTGVSLNTTVSGTVKVSVTWDTAAAIDLILFSTGYIEIIGG